MPKTDEKQIAIPYVNEKQPLSCAICVKPNVVGMRLKEPKGSYFVCIGCVCQIWNETK